MKKKEKHEELNEQDLLDAMPEAPVMKEDFHFGKIGLRKIQPDMNNIEKQNREMIENYQEPQMNRSLEQFPTRQQEPINQTQRVPPVAHRQAMEQRAPQMQQEQRMQQAPMDEQMMEPPQMPPQQQMIQEPPRMAMPQAPAVREIRKPNHAQRESLFNQIDQDLELKDRARRSHKRSKQPLFVETKKYKKMVSDLNSIKNNMSVIESKYSTIIKIKDQEDSKMNKLASTCEDLQRKLLYIDKVLFDR